MRVVQMTKPNLGREVLRLWIRKVVALVDLDGLGLAKLVALLSSSDLRRTHVDFLGAARLAATNVVEEESM